MIVPFANIYTSITRDCGTLKLSEKRSIPFPPLFNSHKGSAINIFAPPNANAKSLSGERKPRRTKPKQLEKSGDARGGRRWK
ncbi:hypothetical protein CEXT_727341 [Caerostris extrusa]|uniref:Uncharacterized protein n=1 Tax=Caerostris extrusa TaxID=172846 RepID=A0AAV4U3K6_CAEEX|nr:hypothetical protein CEXT_727341 [Caerostris extrusa]